MVERKNCCSEQHGAVDRVYGALKDPLPQEQFENQAGYNFSRTTSDCLENRDEPLAVAVAVAPALDPDPCLSLVRASCFCRGPRVCGAGHMRRWTMVADRCCVLWVGR